MSRRPALYVALIAPKGMAHTTELIDATVAIGYGARDLGAAYDKYTILRGIYTAGFEVALVDILTRRVLRSTSSPSPVEFDPAIEITAEMPQEAPEIDPETTMVPMAPLPAVKLSEPMARALGNLDDAKPNTLTALETRGLVAWEPGGNRFKAKLTSLGRRMFRRNQAK